MKHAGVIAAVALFAAAGHASAQDWSGPYVGVSLGHASGDSDGSLTLGGNWSIESQTLRDGVTNLWKPDLSPEGWSYGLQIGVNHQSESGWVFGGELGYSLLDADDSRLTPQTAATSTIPSLTYSVGNSAEIDSVFSATAHLGYDFKPILGYVILGYSWADATYGAEVLSNGGYSKIGQGSETVGGFTYGLGGAAKISPDWSMRLDWTRTDFEETAFSTTYRAGSTFTSPAYTETFEQDLSLDTIRLGLNFHF